MHSQVLRYPLWCLLFVFALCAFSVSQAEPYQITDSFGKHWFEKPPERVVTTDWTLLEQMLELGIEPVGAPELDAYRRLVVQPSLPEHTQDIGLRRSPRLATMRTLSPDLIILGTNQKELARPFSLISEVAYYKSFSDRYRTNGKKSRQRFLEVAQLFQKTELAEKKLAERDRRLAELKAQIHQHFNGNPPAITTVRFSSDQKVLIYGHNSMPSHTLELLGLKGELSLDTNTWGETEVFIDKLSQVQNSLLLYFEPFDYKDTVFSSSTWQQLPVVEKDQVYAVSPAWSYGGAMSVLYIAEAITQTLLNIPYKAQ